MENINKIRQMHYIIVLFETLSKFAMRISIKHTDQAVVKFINDRKEITIKGVMFKRNDNKLSFNSAYGKVVGEIQGLSGISPNRQVTIHTKDPTLLTKIKSDIIVSLQNLVDVVKYFDNNVILTPNKSESPMVLVRNEKVTDNSTKSLLSSLQVSIIDSPSLDAPVRYSNHTN